MRRTAMHGGNVSDEEPLAELLNPPSEHVILQFPCEATVAAVDQPHR